MTRPDWNNYFMNIAKEISTRATCPRASVGAVIVKNNRILSTGYNGAPVREPHCTEVGCEVVDNHCVRVIHAEVNAVCQAAKHGITVEEATLYIYGLNRPESCRNCIQVMQAAGLYSYVEMIDGALIENVL